MNFSILESIYKKWKDILVIGETISHDNDNCHIIGMTLSDEANLYILEPYRETLYMRRSQKGIHSQRRILKESKEADCQYLHCATFHLGDTKLQIQGGTRCPLEHAAEDQKIIHFFVDMINAGWTIPEWLKRIDWCNLQLVTLHIADLNDLPAYSPQMPIMMSFHPTPVCHILGKTVTFRVGKSRNFSFYHDQREKVWCYINRVTLIDAWKYTKEQINDPKLTEGFTPEQLQQFKEYRLNALAQDSLKGMCYFSIEYECSKDLDLRFYSRQYLSSTPEAGQEDPAFVLTHFTPDKKTGTHDLPLKGCVIHTPVTPDTTVIFTELLHYYENVDGRIEILS